MDQAPQEPSLGRSNLSNTILSMEVKDSSLIFQVSQASLLREVEYSSSSESNLLNTILSKGVEESSSIFQVS